MALSQNTAVWPAVAVAAQLALCSSLLAVEPKVKKLDTAFPSKEYKATGSGSGVIIGPRLVLTNRHVAMDGTEPATGFQILLGPDYKKKITARAAWVCENYDLAILESSDDLPSSGKLLLLNDLPPLGTKVTASGFPLGDEFGIGLTVSGGQITRHPVEADDATENGSETANIKRSLWHDATTAGGSSGGPLFTSRSVLVGLHYGSLVAAKGQGIAVPPAVIASMLKKANADARVKYVDSKGLSKAASEYDQKLITVFINVFGDGSGRKAYQTDAAVVARSRASIEARIKDRLQGLTDKEFEIVFSGRLTPLYPSTRAADIKKGQVVRLNSKMTVIQITDEGPLVEIDGVLCKMILPQFDAREARAKVGTDIVRDVPIDKVFIVGEATDYTTVRGTKGSYMPLVAAEVAFDLNAFTEVFDTEKERRTLAAKTERGDFATTLEEILAMPVANFRAAKLARFYGGTAKLGADGALTEVELSSPAIDNAQLATFPWKELRSLRVVSLQGTSITDAALPTILSIPTSIRILSLSAGTITPNVVSSIRSHFRVPRCFLLCPKKLNWQLKSRSSMTKQIEKPGGCQRRCRSLRTSSMKMDLTSLGAKLFLSQSMGTRNRSA